MKVLQLRENIVIYIINASKCLPFLTANPHPRLGVDRAGPVIQVLFAGL